jgi:Symplekin tight junction protein C terminal
LFQQNLASLGVNAGPQPVQNAGVGEQRLSPAEILVAVNSLEAARDGVSLKSVMAALNTCMSMRAEFPPEALAAALQQLVQRYIACKTGNS